MGYFSELQIDILEMHDDGFTVTQIADRLNLSTEEVSEVIEGYESGEYDSDGQPDEAQEWYDFDPDC